jgi:hypothetical protein
MKRLGIAVLLIVCLLGVSQITTEPTSGTQLQGWYMRGRLNQLEADQEIDRLAGLTTIVGVGPIDGCMHARKNVESAVRDEAVRMRWYANETSAYCCVTNTKTHEQYVVEVKQPLPL